MRALLGLSIFAVAAAAAACGGDSVPTSRNIGLFELKDTSDGVGGYVAKPTGKFWNTASGGSLPDSRSPIDTCIDQTYFNDTTTTHLTNQLNAGDTVVFQSSEGMRNMLPDTIPGVLVEYRATAYTPLIPGGDVTWVIPGAAGGIDAETFTANTPKPLILGPIDPLPVDSLHLTWVTGQPDTSAVVIELISVVAPPGGSGHQIFCRLEDTGSFYMNLTLSAKWKAAHATFQTVKAYRFLTTVKSSVAQQLTAEVEFDTVKTTFP
jgi:hypothetical protein